MNARVDPDAGSPPSPTLLPNAIAGALAVPPGLPVSLDPDDRSGNDLPSDHPAWAKDSLSLSQRARAMFARLKPVVIKVLTFWDHRVRSIFVGGRKLSVDASGSYRLD